MGEVTQDTIHTPHTPGPWYARGTRVYSAGDQGEIAVATKADPTHRSAAPANAVLIAAAPDLLAALKAVVERSSGHLYTTDQETGETFDALARAAIARAEGRAE